MKTRTYTQAKLFFDKTIYSFRKGEWNGHIRVECHIDHPHDEKKTMDISADIVFCPAYSDEELVKICLLTNGIDPDNYETKNF